MAEENKNIDNDDVNNEDVNDQDNADKGSDDKSTKKDDKGSDDKSGDKGAKMFTQDQVTKMMTKEKNQGRAAALKELGIDPKDSKMVNMVKSLIDSQKSDEQKATEKQAEEASKIEEANQRALTAEAKAEAMQMGVKSQYVEDVVTLALAKMSDDSDLKTIIGEFKTKYPVWFGESGDDDKQDNKKKVGQKGTGSSVSNSGKEKKGEEKGLGARLAAQRKTSTKKTSYWGNK